jgi:hypothetical protein
MPCLSVHQSSLWDDGRQVGTVHCPVHLFDNLHVVCPACLFIDPVYGMTADRWEMVCCPVHLFDNLHVVGPACLFINPVYGMKADRWKLAHGPVPLYKNAL